MDNTIIICREPLKVPGQKVNGRLDQLPLIYLAQIWVTWAWMTKIYPWSRWSNDNKFSLARVHSSIEVEDLQERNRKALLCSEDCILTRDIFGSRFSAACGLMDQQELATNGHSDNLGADSALLYTPGRPPSEKDREAFTKLPGDFFWWVFKSY